MKRLKRFLSLVLLVAIVFMDHKADVQASAYNENIDVYISIDSEVYFHPDGTPYEAFLAVYNEGNGVPIKIVSITMTECNGWELVTSDTPIEVNKKQFVYQFDGRDMLGGRNEMNLRIEDSDCVAFFTKIQYGAWTYASPYLEKALEIEAEFEIVD